MKIILNEPSYNLKAPNMLCDNCIDPNIKAPFPNNSGYFMVICGIPGSGKTSTLINMLDRKNNIYYKKFDKISLVMPNSSRKSIK
jgi:Cdc6-like AAA superfamily ATPase